jgi:hypothetical protein
MVIGRFPTGGAAASRSMLAMLASVIGMGPALAADMQGHAITYTITVDKPPANTWVDGQASVTLSKTCDAWNYSSAIFYGIERNQRRARPPNQPLSTAADSYQEWLKLSEKFNGTSLQYEGRYHVNGRGEEARGSVVLGADGSGLLDVMSDKLPRKEKLPPGTLLPMAMRSKLIDALAAGEPNKPQPPLAVRTIELGRFYVGIDATLAPQAAPLGRPAKGGDGPRVRSPLLEGRSWTLKQTSQTLSDWMASTFELNHSGVIPRFTFQREGITWRAEVKEINAFTSPSCGR